MVTGCPVLPLAQTLQSRPPIGSTEQENCVSIGCWGKMQAVGIGQAQKLALLGDSACVNILVVSFNGACLPAAQFFAGVRLRGAESGESEANWLPTPP